VEQAVASAFADAEREVGPVDVACLKLAGFGRADERLALREWADPCGLARRVMTFTDGALVVAAGTPRTTAAPA
jgi:hypothetical protein